MVPLMRTYLCLCCLTLFETSTLICLFWGKGLRVERKAPSSLKIIFLLP